MNKNFRRNFASYKLNQEVVGFENPLNRWSFSWIISPGILEAKWRQILQQILCYLTLFLEFPNVPYRFEVSCLLHLYFLLLCHFHKPQKILLFTWIEEVIKGTLGCNFLSQLCSVEIKPKENILLCTAQQSRPRGGRNSDCCHICVFKEIELNCLYINTNFKLTRNPKAF